MSNFISRLSKKMSCLYSSSHLEELAREVGFIRRQSKLNATMFLDLLLYNVFDNGEISLNDHSTSLLINHGVQVRKQSLHERFNHESVAFIRTLLEQQLANQISHSMAVPVLEKFSSVKIKDSTRFQIPALLKKDFAGSGGSGAAVHVQFEYDLCSGKVNDLHITDGLHQDAADARDTVEQIEPGSLLLRDLGYFSSDVLQRIDAANAYYVSRLLPKMKIYQLKDNVYNELDIVKVKAHMEQHGIHCQELEVYIGVKQKVRVRLIIESMTTGHIQKRLARANREARKYGGQVSQKYKAYASLNLFITNVPTQWLSTDQVHHLYRLRWQIELRFKTWKGYCNIHASKKMNLHRFITYLYGCLLFIFVSWELSSNLLSIVWKQSARLLSINKCYKAIIGNYTKLKEALFDPVKLPCLIKSLYASSHYLWLERRKNHLSLAELFSMKPLKKGTLC